MPKEGLIDIDVEMGEMESELDPVLLSFQASAVIAVCAGVIIGNAFICALNCFKSHVHGIYLKFVLFSAAMNLIAALVCMPLMAACLIQGEWKFGYLLCRMTGGICFGSMLLTMLFCMLASLSKLLLYLNVHFPKLRCDIFFQRDFSVILAVLLFAFVSFLVLCFLVDISKVRLDPPKMMCLYTNSPNLTGYRIFYIVYSVLLTFADLMLVVPVAM